MTYEYFANFSHEVGMSIMVDLVSNGVWYVSKKVFTAIKILVDSNKKGNPIRCNNIEEDYFKVAKNIIRELGDYKNIKNIKYIDISNIKSNSRFKYDFITADLYDITLAKTDNIKYLGYKIAEPIEEEQLYIIPSDEIRTKMLLFFQWSIILVTESCNYFI